MPKGLLAWNIILSLLVAFLLFKQFSPAAKTSTTRSKTSGSDTAQFNGQFKMAYFEMDSIAANFDLVKELKTELTKKEEAITAEINRKSKEIQEKINYYQNLDQNNKLSQEQSQAANVEITNMNEALKNRRQQLDQDYNSFMMTKQNEIKSKIEDFLKEYNKTRNFSYIVSYEQGLFYFKDTAYNITADIVKGLNQKYKKN
jgi:outer membrane protein